MNRKTLKMNSENRKVSGIKTGSELFLVILII